MSIDPSSADTHQPLWQAQNILRPVAERVEGLVCLYREAGQDTFIFRPVAGNQFARFEVFLREVVPALKEALYREVK